jgi:hypothetical protein
MKGKPAKPGIGSGLQNTRTIATEKSHKKSIGCGLPSTYFGNSRAIDTARGKK